MYAFEYLRATSLVNAEKLLADNPDAKLLAGGHTLIPAMKLRLSQPSQVIDVARIEELAGIEVNGMSVAIGAMTRHVQVVNSADVVRAIPALAALAAEIGDQQVRNRGTLGGSVANNDPAADYPAAVLGLGATIATNKRDIPADDYFMGLFSTALEEGEIIVRIVFPVPRRAAYAKFRHPASGMAMAGVFIAETVDCVRVAVTGAGASGVFRWKDAESALAKNFSAKTIEGLKLDARECTVDMHAGSDYRAHLVGVLAKSAMQRITAQGQE